MIERKQTFGKSDSAGKTCGPVISRMGSQVTAFAGTVCASA
jgi:hypothetical protein